MQPIISRITDTLFVSDSPWQFRLLSLFVIFFFFGGLSLDYWASSVDFSALSEETYNKNLDDTIIEFTKQKHLSLTSSATLLYDFSKIALGALLGSITQGLRVSSETANGANVKSKAKSKA